MKEKKSILEIKEILAINIPPKRENAAKGQMRAVGVGVNIHGRLRWRFDPTIFKRAGYKNMNHWINDCYALLKMEVDNDTTDADV
jgi:hypothetical protein